MLLCALALSGWGGVLAATLCPYAASEATLKADEHASCHAKGVKADADSSGSTHEAMGGMEAMPQTKGESQAAIAQLAAGRMSCCISHSNLPITPTGPRETQPAGREKNHADTQGLRAIAPYVTRFALAVVPTQGSPPGQLTRRHLLLNVFII
jgi:hypothetical protein